MPTPVKVTIPHFNGRFFTVDLDYARLKHRSNSAKCLEKIANAHENGLPVRYPWIETVIREAIQASPLSILSTGGINFLKIQGLINSTIQPKYQLVEPDEAIKAMASMTTTTLLQAPDPRIEKAIRLAKAVENLERVMDDDGINPHPLSNNAKIEWIGEKTGEDDMVFFTGHYPLFAPQDDNISFMPRHEAMALSEKCNPTGKDGMLGPIYGNAAIRQSLTVKLDDISSMLEDDVLNDQETVFDEKTNGLDWTAMWGNLTIFRAEGILDSVETETLKARLAPTLDLIIENLKDVASTTSDDELLNDAISNQIDQHKEEMESIIAKWNGEQSAYDYGQDNSSLLTIAKDMTRDDIIQALKISVHNGLKEISGLLKEIGVTDCPWIQNIEHIVEEDIAFLTEPSPEPVRPVMVQKPNPKPEPTTSPEPTPSYLG